MLSLVGVGTSVTCVRYGGMATVNVVIARALLVFPAESVTLTVQLEYAPSGRVLNVTGLLPAEAEEVELLQLPPYVIGPASFELNV